MARHTKSIAQGFIAGFGLAAANASVAVHLSNDSTGQVLIYPYYTVQSGNQTLISVRNTSQLGKALKLRIFEGRNSREVLSLNLYLGPEDIWTAAIFATTDSAPGALISNDTSCTVPQLNQSEERINGLPYRSFSNVNYVSFNADGGPTTLERTREGHVEIIEMASILPDSTLAALVNHEAGTPTGCDALAREWLSNPGGSGPYFSSISAASGGLTGTAAIVNSAEGISINFSPETLDGFYRISEHTRPDSPIPSLRSAKPESIVLHDGEAIRSSWSNSEDAVSALFMAERLHNEFTNEAALNAASEWVLTFPTKRFYTDSALNGLTAIPVRPFTRAMANGHACELADHYIYDRSGGGFRVPGASSAFPPLPPISYCHSINIATIQQQILGVSRVLGSRTLNNISTQLTVPSGWLEIDFSSVVSDGVPVTREMRASLEGHVFVGLPVIGFSAVRLENNSAAPGIRGYYGGASNHKRKIRCAPVGTTSGENCSE